SILRQLAPMELPPRRRYDRDGKPRVIMESPTFGDLLKLGFDQIRTFGESHTVILLHLLGSMPFKYGEAASEAYC
ncbi:MAG TPA: DUF2254 family protein, partial [Chloroflexota bacterium]|nr:DUF2254 family protein [Chloroflexota bacterium]